VLVQPTRLGNPNRVASCHVGKEMQQRDLCGARQGRAQLAIEGMPAKTPGWRAWAECAALRREKPSVTERAGRRRFQGEEGMDLTDRLVLVPEPITGEAGKWGRRTEHAQAIARRRLIAAAPCDQAQETLLVGFRELRQKTRLAGSWLAQTGSSGHCPCRPACATARLAA